MAVARPSVYRVGTPQAGGGAAPLGEALAGVGRTLERRKEKRERKREALATLAAKNRFADWYNGQLAEDAFDEMSADDVRSRLDEQIRTEVGSLHNVSEEAAVQLDYELSVEASRHVGAAVDRERRRNRAVASATITKTQERLDTAIGEHARSLQGGTPDEQQVAFEALQLVQKDWDRALQQAPEEARVAVEGWVEERMAHHRRYAYANDAVRRGVADEVLGRIENRTDYYVGSSGERITAGMTPDEVRAFESHLMSEATKRDNRRSALLDRTWKEKQRTEADANDKLLARWIEDGMPDVTEFTGPLAAKGLGDRAAAFARSAASYGTSLSSAEQTRRAGSVEAAEAYTSYEEQIDTAARDDLYSLRQQILQDTADDGVLDMRRGQALLGSITARAGVLDHRDRDLTAEQRRQEEGLDYALKTYASRATRSSGGMNTRDELAAAQIQHGLYQMAPDLRDFQAETGMDPDLVVSLAYATLDATHAESVALGEQPDSAYAQRQVQAARAGLRRVFDLVASSGYKPDSLTERLWMRMRMSPELYAVLDPHFDEDGVLAGSAFTALEHRYNPRMAAALWHRNVKAFRNEREAILGHVGPMEMMRSGVDANKYRAQLEAGQVPLPPLPQEAERAAQAERARTFTDYGGA